MVGRNLVTQEFSWPFVVRGIQGCFVATPTPAQRPLDLGGISGSLVWLTSAIGWPLSTLVDRPMPRSIFDGARCVARS